MAVKSASMCEPKQSLCTEENRLLNCLRRDYGCAMLVFNSYTDNWLVIRRNSNSVACSLDSCMITLDRNTIHLLDDVCYY